MSEPRQPRPSRDSIRGVLVRRLLSVVLALLVVQAALYYREFHKDEAAYLRSSMVVSRGVARLFISYIQDVRHDELVAGNALVSLKPFGQEQANEYLKRVIGERGEVNSIWWANPEGRVEAATSPEMVGQSIAASPEFREVLAGRDWFVTDVVRSADPYASAFSLVQSVRDAHGGLEGVVVASISPEKMRSWFSIKREPTFSVNVVDRSGWLVYRDPPLPLTYRQREYGRFPTVREALAGKESSGEIYADYSHEYRYLAQVPIPEIGWAAGGGFARAAVVDPLYRDMARDLGLLVGVAILAVALALRTAQGLINSLARLGHHAEEVGRGHLEHRAEVQGPGEVATLAAAFNRMADEVKARQSQQQHVLELERERARQAHQIAETRQLLDTIVEHTETHLAYLDCELKLIRANAAFAQTAGCSSEEMVGRSIFEFFPVAAEGEFRRVRERGEAAGEREMPDPVSGAYWDWTLTPVRSEAGEVVGLVFSAVEVTEKVEARARIAESERKRAELAETLNREIAHRVKNNLAMVAGMLQLQIAQQSEERVAAALREAMTRLFAFASINEELQNAEGDRLDLVSALRRVGEATSQVFAAKEVELSVEGDATLCPSRVVTDFSIIANELITNAIKHGAPASGRKLQIEVGLERREGRLRLSVWNSGRPVSLDLDPRVSQGLGLRLVSGLVEDRYSGSFTLRPERNGTLAEVVVAEEEVA